MSSLLIKALLQLFAFMPLWLNRQIGTLLGLALYVLNGQTRKVSAENIVRCFPEMSAEAQDILVRNSLVETAKMSLEVAPVWLRPWSWLEPKIRSIKGESLLKDAVQAPEGLVVLVPHLGNWEVFAPYFSSFTHLTALYQPPKIPAFDRIIREAREKMGASLVPTNRKGVAALLKSLKTGGLTIILPDQVADTGTQHVDFFGHPAHTMTLVSNLMNRTGCKVIMGFVQRVPGGFELHFENADPEIYSENLSVSLAAMNRSVENCVRQVPEQYQWEYKRFRRPPEGSEKPYRF